MKLRKKIVLVSLTVVLGLVAVDLLAAYGLFFYQKTFVVKNIWGPVTGRNVAYSDGVIPTVSIIKTVIDRIEAKLEAYREAHVQREGLGDPPDVLFKRNTELGWAAAPGSYELFFTRPQAKFPEWPRFHNWAVTILPDGSRATSRRPVNSDHNMLIFGDSWLFGWALDNELTMAWHLQNEYKDHFSVRLFAGGGYGHLQALRNFQKWQSAVGKDDVLIFGYAQWLLPRNLPAPSVVRSLADGMKQYAEGPGKPLTYPRATLIANRLVVDTIPLDCGMAEGYCEKPDPTLDGLFDVTNKIFDEIIDHTGAKIFVLLLDGSEDKVIEHLKHRKVTVVDGRPPEGIFAKDTMNPYDAHPGPISNLYWSTQLRKEIDRLL